VTIRFQELMVTTAKRQLLFAKLAAGIFVVLSSET